MTGSAPRLETLNAPTELHFHGISLPGRASVSEGLGGLLVGMSLRPLASFTPALLVDQIAPRTENWPSAMGPSASTRCTFDVTKDSGATSGTLYSARRTSRPSLIMTTAHYRSANGATCAPTISFCALDYGLKCPKKSFSSGATLDLAYQHHEAELVRPVWHTLRVKTPLSLRIPGYGNHSTWRRHPQSPICGGCSSFFLLNCW